MHKAWLITTAMVALVCFIAADFAYAKG